jgi:hypothetical protein
MKLLNRLSMARDEGKQKASKGQRDAENQRPRAELDRWYDMSLRTPVCFELRVTSTIGSMIEKSKNPTLALLLRICERRDYGRCHRGRLVSGGTNSANS